MPPLLATTGDDRQLHLVDAEGRGSRPLTFNPGANPLLLWGQPGLRRSSWSWPCWRPDGGAVAAFELPDDAEPEGPARVHVLDVDGVRQIELAEITGEVPIYCAWRPDGRALAVLLQADEGLRLEQLLLDRPGQRQPVEEGSPLFFTWAPDGHGLLTHAGEPAAARASVSLRDPSGERPARRLLDEPGAFCAPVVVDGRVAVVARSGEVNRLLLLDPDGEGRRELLEFQGLGAILPAAPGRLLFSAAPGGQGSPYRGATLIDLDGGPARRLIEDDCLAMLWSPRGELLYVRVQPRRNCLTWHRATPGAPPEELAAFWPTREQLFALHYFDQFVLSHPPLSADGRHLVFAGSPVGGPTRPRDKGDILVMDLDAPGPPRRVGEGTFACFSPGPP